MNAGLLRKHATSIALVVLALGLGGYVLVVDRGKPSSDELASRKDNLFAILRRDDLSNIQIVRDNVHVQLLRRGAPDAGDSMFWFVSGSIDETADQIAVEQLLQAIEFAKRIRKLDPPVDRAGIGLDKPRARLTLRMGDLAYTVALGADAKTPRGAAFAELEGEGVFVVSPDFVRAVLAPLDALRSHSVLPYTSSVLSAIALDGLGGHRRFVRGPWGGFRLDGSPPGPRVEQSVFDRMLSAFASINAEQFLDDAAADAALAPPDARITLTLEPKDTSKPTATIELGGPCPTSFGDAGDSAAASNLIVAIRRQPTRLNACVPASVLDDLRAPAQSFVDKKLLSIRQDEIEELTVTQGDRVLDLARTGQGWHLRKPEDKNLSEAEAAGLVDGILGIEGEIVPEVDQKAAGLEPPYGSLVVRTHGLGEEAQGEQKIRIGSGTGDIYALREQDGIVLRLPRALARALEPSLTQLRSTTLLEVSAGAVQKVDIILDGKGFQTISRSGAGFTIDEPRGFDADATIASDMFAAIATLHADRWIADRDDGSFGLGTPRIDGRFLIKDESGTKTRRLLVGTEVPGGSYARFEPDTGVFVLSRSMENTLRGLAIDRSSLMVDPSEVKSVRLKTADNQALLLPQGERWAASPDAGVALAEVAAGRIQRALIELRAERVAHVGAAKENEGFDKPSLEIVVQRIPGRGERSTDMKIAIGRADSWRSMNVFYARRDGIDATFVIPASRVQPLLDAMSARSKD